MNQDRWKRIKEILEVVVELAPEERENHLATACGEDASLRREVESFLRADADRVQPLLPSLTAPPAEEDMIGTRIGPYRLESELGRGGLGVVYLAEREEAFQQQVAIKLLKRGMDSDEILRRFHAERQILANLKHSNTAQILDGGTTENGRPYFVMEYIEGRRIDTFCDEETLSTRERLGLFRKVCDVVYFAHQNLVVHRDLKPGNILVTDQGEPKLLDFGIARLLTHEPSKTVHLNDRRLTPAYASPEQVCGETIATTSDVYSLGVVLYELLTGRRPYYFHERTEAEFRRVISHENPPKPSIVITQALEHRYPTDSGRPVTPEAVAKARDSEPRSIARRLAGDLDNIVLRALSKRSQDRYSSVEQFSEDIQRHLEGHPVRARAATALYRFGKLVQRNRLRFAAALLLLGLGVASLTNSFLHQQQLTRERDKFRYIAGFLTDLFQTSDPVLQPQQDLTARELLDQAAQRIAASSEEPEVRADLAQTIGLVYVELGLYEDGEKLLAEALDLRRAAFGARHESVAEVLSNHGIALAMMGRSDEALLDLEAGVDIRRETSPGAAVLADSLYKLAATYYESFADYQAAEQFHLEALDIRERRLGPENAAVAESLNFLGLVYKDQQRFDDAEAVLSRSLAIHQRLHGPTSVQAAKPMHNLALVYRAQGKLVEAEKHHRESLAIHEATYGPNHPAVATGLNVLGLFLRRQDRYEEALPIYQRSLRIRQNTLGDEHPSTSSALHHLGSLYLDMDNLEAANHYLEKAVAVREKVLPREHPSRGASLLKLAELRTEQTQYQEAEEVFKRAIAVLDITKHPRSVTARERYAALLRILGREGTP